MKNHCSGFIFLMTLCVILVISLLVLASMQQVLLYYKAINRQEVLHQNFYQLEHLAMQLVRSSSLHTSKDCYLQEDNANTVIKKLINKGCSIILSQKKYLYGIEDLGEFPCLVLEQGGQKYISHHFRVTVLQDEQDIASSVIQLRFIKLSSSSLSCSEEEIWVKEGVSSWRYLSDYKNHAFILNNSR